MTVTKQQQLEWLASAWDEWSLDRDFILMSVITIGYSMSPATGKIHQNHKITNQEWQQERDKMQKQQDDSWHERGEFPPVGCECEAFADGCEPEPCTILAIHNGAAAVKWSKFNNGGLDVITLNGWSFRPLRTEREKAIDEMMSLVMDGLMSHDMAKELVIKLHDAGYRKVKQ